MKPENILRHWMATYMPLDGETQARFLARPETTRLTRLDDDLVFAAIRWHMKLEMILDHSLVLDLGYKKAGAGSMQTCGCVMAKPIPSQKPAEVDSKKPSSLSRKKPKPSAKKSQESVSPASNQMPFDSDRYGGPAYRNPPAPPGTIAKGW